METEQPQSEIDRLLTTLNMLEQQRGIVGDAINPAIEVAEQKLMEALPAEPSQDQIETAEKWRTFVEMSESLGLPAPEPTEAIVEATRAIDAYQEVQQKVGILGVASSAEVVDVPTTPEAKPKRSRATKPKADVPAKEDTVPNPETPEDNEVVLSVGDKEYKLLPINRAMNLRLLKALAESPEGIDTSVFAREVSGGMTSYDIQHAKERIKQGKEPNLPEGVVLEEADRVIRQFYTVLSKLKQRGVVEHERGNRFIAPGRDRNTTGHMRLAGPIEFIEEDGVTRIVASRRPYELLLNLYDHSIENGRGKRVEINKEDEAFLRISRALGAIALKTPEQHERITRTDITSWIDEIHGSDITANPGSQARLADDLREVIRAFDQEFPLSAHGKSGGSHYKWESTASVETIDGWPEKPNFDEAVHVSISSTGIVAAINGETKTLLSYDSGRFQALMDANDFNLDKTIENYEAFFQMLSLLDSRTKVSLEDGVDMMLGSDVDKTERSTAVNRFRAIVKKLNKVFGEDIVNWQNHSGVVLDVNRKIIVENDGSDNSSADVPKDNAPAGSDDHARPRPNPSEDTTGVGGIDIDDLREVGPVKTADQIIDAVNNLDAKTKLDIRGLLIQNGRFEYPKKIEEAVYLLELVLDATVGAELREHSRFNRDGYRGYQDFIHEVVLACYFRTLSWGEFGEIISAIKIRNDGSRNISAFNLIEAAGIQAKDSVSSLQESAANDRERIKNVAFSEKLLDNFINGCVMKPENPVQAITMLEIFRKNRQLIAQDKTQAQFDAIVKDLHDQVAEVLGSVNTRAAIESRTARRASYIGRAVQTSGGEEAVLLRTDGHRVPDKAVRHRRRRR